MDAEAFHLAGASVAAEDAFQKLAGAPNQMADGLQMRQNGAREGQDVSGMLDGRANGAAGLPRHQEFAVKQFTVRKW